MMMSATLTYLAWTVLLTSLMWIPYVLDRMKVWGLTDTVGYPDNPKALSPWAQRAKKAHKNAVENLVVFAALVLIAAAAGATGDTTATAALIYLLARVVHYAVYIAKLPWLRTLAFAVGWICQLVVAGAILF